MFNTSLNNALTRANSDLIAGYAMPSNNYESLVVAASNNSYIAPANGWFCLITKSTSAVREGSACLNNTTANIASLTWGIPADNDGSAFLPVKKGDSVTESYYAATNPRLYFIYAEGEPANV